ncbi:hypothetical protein [Metapseudomonas resinovorans]|uniref:Transmembrane sensor/regulator PpyR n=1 Tax=Metapseudomonas resinovorans NBRC 106553 TaxID=1245471 RepID=S6AS27_METRE|nr:hypothetical protein [Pseudomonas resinovorans]BAN48798.1 hypothetical protein PCA10_30660 [Pseudomonas resinovorans NBRC 106553]
MFDFLENPCQALKLSNQVLASGVVMLLLGILLAYVVDDYLSMLALLMAHLMTMLGPTAIKLGYVLRLLALKRLSAR